MLSALPIEEEINEIVKKMKGDAAPRSDGFNGIFFKKFWHIIKEEVIKAVQDFFNGANLPRGYTCSNLSHSKSSQSKALFGAQAY